MDFNEPPEEGLADLVLQHRNRIKNLENGMVDSEGDGAGKDEVF
jgi:hypothetical protein